MVTASAERTTSRIASIDVLRGLIMVIMALDHVREYFGATPFRAEDIAQTTVPYFFARWITHLCAPNFVFLSGLSIWLYSQKKANPGDTSVFLLTRGMWLIAVEVLVITFLLSLSYQLIVLQVIWVIGWSMVFFAVLIRLPRTVIGVLAVLIIAGHGLIPDSATTTTQGVLAGIMIHTPFVIINSSGVPFVLVAYTILPWMGIMMAGYYVGGWFTGDVKNVPRRLQITGFVMLGAFILLRSFNLYGDPVPWAVQDRAWVYSALSFINVSKYPPSFQFFLLMVGIGMLGLSLFSRIRSGLTDKLRTYGEVPFFYYVLHFTLISVGAFLWTKMAFGDYVNLAFANPAQWPPEYSPNLLRVVLVWFLVVVVLYFPCRWFANYRRGHKTWWLSYL